MLALARGPVLLQVTQTRLLARDASGELIK
jgi:hypothetical protein